MAMGSPRGDLDRHADPTSHRLAGFPPLEVTGIPMTRLANAFSRGPALVTFITAGDGDTAANLDALVAGGADVVELGMPFTDPMADGPAIQAANLRSLAKGTTTREILMIANE